MTPSTELAQPVQEQHVQGQGREEPQKLNKSEKGNGLGVFAKILAGLTKPIKTGNGAAVNGVQTPEKFPLAEKAGSGEKTKNTRLSKADVTDKLETKKSLKNGKNEAELPEIELSASEKGLFSIGRITGQGEEQGLKAKKEATIGGLTADLRRTGRESGKNETASAQLMQGEGLNRGEKQSLTATATGELAENAKTAGEKAKNRPNIAEISAKNRLNTGEALNEGNFQRIDAKKAALGEEKGKNRLEELRNRRRVASFDVRDSRTGQTVPAQHGGAVQLPAGFETRVPGEGTFKDITLELRLPNQGQESSSATTSWEVKAGRSFEDMLARELHQNFNNDIVRHASVALRDGNEGTIRLALKPESLGNVKIHLELADNKIIGHIVVESEEALRAFQKEIADLEKAFKDSGFDAANLEMSLAADGRGAENQWQESEASQFLTEQFAASRYDAAIEHMEMPLTLDIYQGTMAVNMLA